MSNNITFKDEKNSVINYPLTTADRIKIMGINKMNLLAILNAVLIDAGRQGNVKLGEYYNNTLHYSIEAMPVQNYVLLDCANWLKEMTFENFSVLKIFVRYNKKEIIVISDKMNDDVLEEFYGKTFELSYMKDSEIVFMITTEDAVDHSAMLNYDKLIEVDKHE